MFHLLCLFFAIGYVVVLGAVAKSVEEFASLPFTYIEIVAVQHSHFVIGTKIGILSFHSLQIYSQGVVLIVRKEH